MTLALKILDKTGETRAASHGEDEVRLVYTSEYVDGDRIVLETSESDRHLVIQLDDAMGGNLVFLKSTSLAYDIPFGEKRTSYSPKAFYGNRHYLYARIARADEITAYRNLALNVYDQHGDSGLFPHAHANTETRGEAVFAARNAIDGVCENRSHGGWPFESWGINRRDDAELTLDFGREVEIDKIVLYTRADFPHDSWWRQVTVVFSDGTSIDWPLGKSELPHMLPIEKRRITGLTLSKLLKADDPSPFPALTQIEVYGRDIEV